MTLDPHKFAFPTADSSKVTQRLAALPQNVAALITSAATALAKPDLRSAKEMLASVLATHPTQPDALRLYGTLMYRQRRYAAGHRAFTAALESAPRDAIAYWQYATELENAGDLRESLRIRTAATKRIPESPTAWLSLGEYLYRHSRDIETVISALQRAAELGANSAPILLKLATAWNARGDAARAAALIRRALNEAPSFGSAWLALADTKLAPITLEEIRTMRALVKARGGIDHNEATMIEFALGNAYEQQGLYEDAWQTIRKANVHRTSEVQPWSAIAFLTNLRDTTRAFASAPATSPATSRGQNLIFVVGMPRSGTTLVDQILASHHMVTSGGELPFIPQILEAESRRRKKQLPEWVPIANAADWDRLAAQYFATTSRLRVKSQFSTDKLPVNWRAIEAICAMFPSSHIVICHRDPMETCWSCFKQYFDRGWQFTYDIRNLAIYWNAFNDTVTRLARERPKQLHSLSYEKLTEHPTREIQALLSFCGLPFDAKCLKPHDSTAGIWTLSATQVRTPIHMHNDVAHRYGALLAPLHDALYCATSALRESA